MVSAEVLRDLNSLQPDEQTLVLSLVKSLNRNAVKRQKHKSSLRRNAGNMKERI